MRHHDSVGNAGVIEAGGVQWMTAGRGVIHSEMPEQESGLLSGFQLWVNLPSELKMTQPRYQEFPQTAIPVERRGGGTSLRVIAGTTSRGSSGPVREVAVSPLYFDVTLNGGEIFEETLPAGHTVFLYAIEGMPQVNDVAIPPGTLAVLGEGAGVRVTADGNARFLLVAGRPLQEPVARSGPFVMNTQAELRQAFNDYSAGRFGSQK
jgi:redox-sensitive bicupin YhaK (pirin superfamily)